MIGAARWILLGIETRAMSADCMKSGSESSSSGRDCRVVDLSCFHLCCDPEHEVGMPWRTFGFNRALAVTRMRKERRRRSSFFGIFCSGEGWLLNEGESKNRADN